MLRAWSEGPDHRMQQAVPYAIAHLREWPAAWRKLDPEQLLLVDSVDNEVMLRRWNFAHTSILPLVPDDAQWLRCVLATFEYDASYKVKLEPLIHAGAFSRVESIHFIHHEQAKFAQELKRVLAVRGPHSPLREVVMEECFFDHKAASELLNLISPGSLNRFSLEKSFKPSAGPYLCDDAWAGLGGLEICGDLVRVEDVEMLLVAPIFSALEELRIGHLLDGKGEPSMALIRKLLQWSEARLERGSPLVRLGLPGMVYDIDTLHELAASPICESMCHLDLRDNVLDAAAIGALFDGPSRWPSLTHLRLGGGSFDYGLDDLLLDRLLSMPCARHLRFLDVSKCHLNALSHVRLLSRKELPALEHLAISDVRLTPELFRRVQAEVDRATAQQDEPFPLWRTLLLRKSSTEEVASLGEAVQGASGAWWREVERVEVEMAKASSGMRRLRTRDGDPWAEILRTETPQQSLRFYEFSPHTAFEFEQVWRQAMAST